MVNCDWTWSRSRSRSRSHCRSKCLSLLAQSLTYAMNFHLSFVPDNWGYHRQGSCQAGFSAAINGVSTHWIYPNTLVRSLGVTQTADLVRLLVEQDL